MIRGQPYNPLITRMNNIARINNDAINSSNNSNNDSNNTKKITMVIIILIIMIIMHSQSFLRALLSEATGAGAS